MTRAQQGAEQLLGAAGLGEDKVGRVADSLVQAADREAQSARSPGGVMRQATSLLQSSAAAAAAAPAAEPEVEGPEVEEEPERPMAVEPEATTTEELEVEETGSEQIEEPDEPRKSEGEGRTWGADDSEKEDAPEEEDETDQKGPGEDEPRRYF